MENETPAEGSTAPAERGYTGDLPGQLLDFRNYVILAFDFLGFTTPTKNQLDMAHYIQSGPKRILAEGFRGVGKSLLLELYVTWCFRVIYSCEGVSPEYAVQNLSANGGRAYNFSSFVLGLIRNWSVLQDLAPGPQKRSATDGFDLEPAPVQDSPSMSAFGVGGMAAGRRADLVCADDVETIQNASTQLMREKLLEQVKEIDAILRPMPKTDEEHLLKFPHLPVWLIRQVTNRVIVLGTPQTEDTIYSEMMKRGYYRRIWPSRYPSRKWMASNGDDLAPVLAEELERAPDLATGWGMLGDRGKATDTRFSEEDLIEREMSFGQAGFALQFMLDASLADADRYPLKLSHLIVMDCDVDQAPEKVSWTSDPAYARKDLPAVGLMGDRYHSPLRVSPTWAPYTGCVMAIDPSGRGKDETAYAIVKMLNSQMFLVESGGYGPGQGYEDNILKDLVERAEHWKCSRVLVEADFGDSMFAKLLQPVLRKIYPCQVEEVRSGNVQKERRILATLEPVMNNRRLIVDPQVILRDQATGIGLDENKYRYQLFYQLTRLTSDKGSLLHDDRLDALQMAVGYWVKSMGQDVDDAIADRREELLDRDLARFLEGWRRREESTGSRASKWGSWRK